MKKLIEYLPKFHRLFTVNNLGSVAQGKPFATSSSNIKAILLTGNVPELIPFKSKQKSSLNPAFSNVFKTDGIIRVISSTNCSSLDLENNCFRLFCFLALLHGLL